jgi:hypothetical protein
VEPIEPLDSLRRLAQERLGRLLDPKTAEEQRLVEVLRNTLDVQQLLTLVELIEYRGGTDERPEPNPQQQRDTT